MPLILSNGGTPRAVYERKLNALQVSWLISCSQQKLTDDEMSTDDEKSTITAAPIGALVNPERLPL